MPDNTTRTQMLTFRTECDRCGRELTRSMPTGGEYPIQNGIMVGCTSCGKINFVRKG
jgi:ribosomal protein S27E